MPYQIASERLSFDETLERFPLHKKWAETKIARLKRITDIPQGAKILDIGAGTGIFLAACAGLGYRCEGIEPYREARLNAARLAGKMGVSVRITEASAEEIPFEDRTFDVVHASSVIEHVPDPEKAFKEIYRVLKPGGAFWFNAASSMCPAQNEIRAFPLFGWYPDELKRRIINWAKTRKPRLVGCTDTPAVNWFTTKRARALLERHGFRRVYDRWDLRMECEGGRIYALALRGIRASRVLRMLADVIIPDCGFAAIK